MTLNATASAAMSDGDSVSVGVLCTSGSVVSVTDSTNANTYTLEESDTTNATSQVYNFTCYGATPLQNGVDIITVTYSTNASAQGVIAVGDPGVTSADITIAAHGSGTTASLATGVLNQSEEHIVCFIVNLNSGGTPTLGGGLTNLGTVTGGTAAKLTAGYHDVTTAVSTTPSGAITSTTWAIAVSAHRVTPVQITANPPGGVTGAAYSAALSSTGGIGPYTYTLASGTLPSGVSISGSTLTGTLTTSGSFVFDLTSTDSVSGSSSTQAYTVVVLPTGPSGTLATSLPHNVLSRADSDFEVSGVTWTSVTNASSVAASSLIAATGTKALKWILPADGVSQVSTGFYPVKALRGMISSGLLLTNRAADNMVSIQYFNSGGTLLGESDSQDWASIGGVWQPLSVTGYTPVNTTKFKILITTNGLAGDVVFLDTCYAATSGSQVLIDWTNPAFAAGGSAGDTFMDVSMFVRLDIGITLSSGRQDAISEIQPGSASFQLQNDTGWFTKHQTANIGYALSGDVDLHARVQVNFIDEAGNWHTRFDGSISEIDYLGDNTGNTDVATVSVGDVMSYMNREDSLNCWTEQTVLQDGPILHWALADAGNTGAQGLAAETSGNGGPPLRTINSDGSNVATIAWQDTTGGIETLADAVKAGASDGSVYWTQGSDQPTSLLRGLDSGAVGPFTSPSPSVYIVPATAAQTAFNTFLGNAGYSLMTRFPPVTPTSTGADFCVEMWFTCDPSILAKAATKLGPYCQLTLGNSKTQRNLSAGIFLTGISTMNYTVKTWDSPPAFAAKNFAGATPPAPHTSMTGVNFIPDAVPIPHHLVLNFQGDPVAPVLTAYLDTVSLGSVNLHQGQNFDTIIAGAGWNGAGSHAGGVQLVSIYAGQMSSSVMAQHCMLGQYGMWEQTSDDVIASLTSLANIPGFWNNIQGAHDGLTMTEYQDITGSSSLTSLQLFEQGEMGLLYVDVDGTLKFQTRDQRMGKGAPDLLLPPDSFDSDAGLELVDQFMVNEQATSSQLFQTGTASVNVSSQNQHGVYAVDPVGSPAQLPLLSWSRAFGKIGLSTFYYWPDPSMDDFSQWPSNSRADPWLVPGQLSIDLLTLNPTTGLKISDFYELSIGSLIAPSGTLPGNWPNESLSTEWFIEGIDEIYSLSTRGLQLYCSAAEPQRAWKAGDPVYGVVGSTTRVGISGPDLNKTQAYGKDVSHDAGRPYWPNDFTNPLFLTGDNTTFKAGIGNWVAATNCAVAWNSVLQSMKMTSTASGDMQATHCTTGNILTQGYPCTPTQPIDLSASAEAAVTPRTFQLGATFFDQNGASLSTIYDATSQVADATTGPVATTGQVTAPAGAFECRLVVDVLATGAANEVHNITDAQIGGVSMNNPAQNNSGFVGGIDIRGITDNLTLLLEPPMMVAQTVSNTQNVTGGSGLAQPQLFFDNVFVDTANGMGAIPGWPNWYVVLVPGFYEMDASITSALSSATTGGYWQGWFIVARQAAQALAAGTGTPVTVNQYICPIGETKREHTSAQNTSCNPSTRMYLGLGDMVAIGAETANTFNTGTGNGGHIFSMIFKGLSALDDEAQVNTSISSGGSVTTPVQVSPGTKAYANTATYSYYGSSAYGNPNGRRNTNGVVYQGTYSGGQQAAGSQYGQVSFNAAQISTDLSGHTITGLSVHLHNEHFWYSSGGTILIGLCYDSPGGSKWVPKNNSKNTRSIVSYAMKEGANIDVPLPISIIDGFISNGATALWIGDNSTLDLSKYGYFAGGPNQWTLNVSYE